MTEKEPSIGQTPVIFGGKIENPEDMTLDEARKVVEAVSDKLNKDATIIWGAQIYKDLEKTIRAMLIVTGVKSSQIFGPGKLTSDRRKQEIEKELGIDFID